jgi:hypothetical protein
MFNLIKNKLANIDIYGQPVTLKSQKPTTNIGGVLTLFTFLIMSVAVISKVSQVENELRLESARLESAAADHVTRRLRELEESSDGEIPASELGEAVRVNADTGIESIKLIFNSEKSKNKD